MWASRPAAAAPVSQQTGSCSTCEPADRQLQHQWASRPATAAPVSQQTGRPAAAAQMLETLRVCTYNSWCWHICFCWRCRAWSSSCVEDWETWWSVSVGTEGFIMGPDQVDIMWSLHNNHMTIRWQLPCKCYNNDHVLCSLPNNFTIMWAIHNNHMTGCTSYSSEKRWSVLACIDFT